MMATLMMVLILRDPHAAADARKARATDRPFACYLGLGGPRRRRRQRFSGSLFATVDCGTFSNHPSAHCRGHIPLGVFRGIAGPRFCGIVRYTSIITCDEAFGLLVGSWSNFFPHFWTRFLLTFRGVSGGRWCVCMWDAARCFSFDRMILDPAFPFRCVGF